MHDKMKYFNYVIWTPFAIKSMDIHESDQSVWSMGAENNFFFIIDNQTTYKIIFFNT